MASRNITLFMMVLILICPLPVFAAERTEIKAAFVREGDLWIYTEGKEQQITRNGNVISKPQWSKDGRYILYVTKASLTEQEKTQTEIWTYEPATGKHKKIFYDGYAPQWSPGRNLIAFKASGILNISDMNSFYNVAAGVDDYIWLPDGTGFLLSSSAVLKPDGWTNVVLYKKKINDNYQNSPLFANTERFFTLPGEIGLNDDKMPAVSAGKFSFSPSGKWISFIASPTASLAMDSNFLCITDRDGKNFEVLDEVIFGVAKPKWAPSEDTIAFIGGSGRLVFGFKNKRLKIRDMPASGTLTPPDYADLDFDWITNDNLVTSRVAEKEWSNDFSKHPLPVLYTINLKTKEQKKITGPPIGFGDYEPQVLQHSKKIIWLRGKSITDKNRTVWISNHDGSKAKEWIRNLESIEVFEEQHI